MYTLRKIQVTAGDNFFDKILAEQIIDTKIIANTMLLYVPIGIEVPVDFTASLTRRQNPVRCLNSKVFEVITEDLFQTESYDIIEDILGVQKVTAVNYSSVCHIDYYSPILSTLTLTAPMLTIRRAEPNAEELVYYNVFAIPLVDDIFREMRTNHNIDKRFIPLLETSATNHFDFYNDIVNNLPNISKVDISILEFEPQTYQFGGVAVGYTLFYLERNEV